MGNLSSKQFRKRHDVIVWDHVATGMQEHFSQSEQQQQLSKTGKKNTEEVGSGFGSNILQFLFNNSSPKNSGKKRTQNKKKATANKKKSGGDSKVVTQDKSNQSLGSILEKKQSNATNVRPRMVKSVQHFHSAKVYPEVEDTSKPDMRPVAEARTPHQDHDMNMFLASSFQDLKKFNHTADIAIHQ